ncbi:MAG: protein translocase subunit SecD [Planctomycetota bacterium]|nr:protein translocase subunit SecD [Planctomycetota bacterium]
MVKNLARKITGLIFFSALALFAIFKYDLNLGLDLKGGARLVYAFNFQQALDDGQISEDEFVNQAQLIQQMADVFAKRLDSSGLLDVPVVPLGDDRIVIEVPGNDQAALDQIQAVMLNQGLLDFSIVANDSDDVGLSLERGKFETWRDANPDADVSVYNKLSEAKSGPRAELRWISVKEEEQGALNVSSALTRGCAPLLVQNELRPKMTGPDAWDFTGGDLSYVGPTMDRSGLPAVAFTFQQTRRTAFAEFTDEYTGRMMAIVLNGVVSSAPEINERLPGQGIINGGTGGFTQDDRQELITVLRTGSLRVLPELESEAVVGPSLGKDSIDAGVRSALIGALIVIAFMIWYYRMNGLVASLALGFNGFLLLGAMFFTQATLTLPGLAGIVLTIGMAVDANILIFERVREEIRRGRDVPQAYKNGYENAASAITDSNLTTLIAAAVLFGVGTGPVKGFAATLGIGILTTLFSVLVFSKVVMHHLVFTTKSLKKVSMVGFLDRDWKIRFLDKRYLAVGFSLITIIGGLIFFAGRSQQLLGIDFAGGTSARITLTAAQDITEVRGRLPGYAVVGVGDSTDGSSYAAYHVKKTLTPEQRAEQKRSTEVEAGKDPTQDMVDELLAAMAGWLPLGADGQIDEKLAFPEVNVVGARVSGEIQTAAVRAILLSLILTIVYISFRFREYRYGFAAVVAVFHDVLFALGALAVGDALGIVSVEINLEIIAAFLTIIGYSLNDTIIIFDRIRENLPKMQNRSYKEVIDLSINQCLGRTILTSVTVLFVVLVLFFANRPFHNSLEGFSFAMIIGVMIGTYSTMFVATPLLITFDRWSRTHRVNGDEGTKVLPARS